MNDQPFPPLEITAYWGDLTHHLIELVACFPSDKLDWRPGPDEWSVKQIVLHIIAARDYWMAAAIKDGGPMPDMAEASKTTDVLQGMLRRSWDRLTANLLLQPEKLAAVYSPPPIDDPGYLDPERFDGNWIAYHRLVHDVHHRADILRYAEQLGIDTSSVRRRRPL